jgi:hypothetical protein
MAKSNIHKMHIRNVNLSRWFPENDQFAAGMARLCILREDFLFELSSWVEAKSVPFEDEFGATSRRMYFFRMMCITLKELRSACVSISKCADFKSFLKSQPKELKDCWCRFKINLDQTIDVIDPLRDEVSAHIKQASIEQALREMKNAERSGILQVSFERPVKTHYKFTGELLMAVILRGVPVDKQEEELKQRIDRIMPALEDLLVTINNLFESYVVYKGLII